MCAVKKLISSTVTDRSDVHVIDDGKQLMNGWVLNDVPHMILS